jgi:hypothetical protein
MTRQEHEELRRLRALWLHLAEVVAHQGDATSVSASFTYRVCAADLESYIARHQPEEP